MGRLISTTTNYAFVPGAYTNAYSYDAASNRASLTAHDGSISTYGYDTLNRTVDAAERGEHELQLRRESHLLSVLHQADLNTLDGASYTYDAGGSLAAAMHPHSMRGQLFRCPHFPGVGL
jgi:hypothetical protein